MMIKKKRKEDIGEKRGNEEEMKKIQKGKNERKKR